ncbi:MAG: hypothetical protein ABIL78_03075 [candidate division WOR-3 bacterium]
MLFNSLLNIFNIFLGFLNLKVLFSVLDIKTLDNFFVIQAISLSICAIFIVSFETTFQNFIPKWDLKASRILFFKALFITSIFYIFFSIIYPTLIFLFPFAIFPLFLTYLYSRKQYTLSNITNTITLILLISLILIFKPKVLIEIFKIYFFVYLLSIIFLIFFIKPIIAFHLDVISKIWDYYKIAFLSSLTSPLYRYLDRFILGFLGNVGDVSGFSLVRRIDNTFRQILNAPLSIATIEISSDITYFNKFFPRYLLIAFILFILEIVLGYLIILLVGGKEFIKFYPSLVVFSIAFLISAIFSILIIKRRVQNEPKPFLIYNVSFVVLFLIFSIILFPIFQSLSIAISFLLSTIFSGFLALIKK